MRFRLVALAAAVALSFVSVAPAVAQDCDVALPSCDGQFGAHTATSGYGQGQPTHGDCMLCQFEGSTVDPTQCHACAQHLDHEQQTAYARILQAGRNADVDEILRLAAAVPGKVRFNPKRAALQITAACDDGTIIASLQLTTPAQIRLAATLPKADGARRATAVQ